MKGFLLALSLLAGLFNQHADAKNFTDLDGFIQQSLTTHNAFRNIHSASPLKQNDEISKIAQSHADFLAANHSIKQSFNKFNTTQLGENILSASGRDSITGKQTY